MRPTILRAPVRVPGFRFAGLSAGIKANGKPDLALAAADTPVPAGAVYTTNLVRAAPVLIAAERSARGRMRGVLANSGCANACTGAAGLEATRTSTAAVAKLIGAGEDEILPASTGVIGALLPASRIVDHAGKLVGTLSEDGAVDFAEAIRTTDKSAKIVHVRSTVAGRPFVMLGLAKGAGMIHPAMAPLHATMLAFLFTDATADGPSLTRALHRAADETFNLASVDGDTSTNDTFAIFASGKADTAPPQGGEIATPVYDAMVAVADELARMMVADGEGAEHLVELWVSGVGSAADARVIARTVATSPLVKTALYGQDPNWGRLLAAAGRAGVAFDPDRARILVGGVPVAERGMATGGTREAEAHEVMKRPAYRIDLVLGEGKGEARYLMSDLGLGYVQCNASYRS